MQELRIPSGEAGNGLESTSSERLEDDEEALANIAATVVCALGVAAGASASMAPHCRVVARVDRAVLGRT
jgi:hypothetical protein